MPVLAFIQATTSARCRSISTVRQIYCVMDGRGKLQIVLSLKDRLCLTFPAPACTLERASRFVPRFGETALFIRHREPYVTLVVLCCSFFLFFFSPVLAINWPNVY